MKMAARQGPWAVDCSAEGASAASTVSVTCEFALATGHFQPRHIRGMRSSWSSEGRPAYGSSEFDRGCPFDTVLVRLIWHASGTAEDGAGLTMRTPAGLPPGPGQIRSSRSTTAGPALRRVENSLPAPSPLRAGMGMLRPRPVAWLPRWPPSWLRIILVVDHCRVRDPRPVHPTVVRTCVRLPYRACKPGKLTTPP